MWTWLTADGYQDQIHKVTIQRTSFFKNVSSPANLNLERKGQGYIFTFLSGPLLQRSRKASASFCQFSGPSHRVWREWEWACQPLRSHPHCRETVGEANRGSLAGPENEADVKLINRRKPYKLIQVSRDMGTLIRKWWPPRKWQNLCFYTRMNWEASWETD